MLDALNTKRTLRGRILAILLGAGAISRSSDVVAAVSSLVSAGGLTACDGSSFGLFNYAKGSNDCAITNGLKVLTSPVDLPWTVDDIGKPIDVQGAGAAGGVLSSVIVGFNSTGSITLRDAAQTSVTRSSTGTGGIAIWGLQTVFNTDPNAIKNPSTLANMQSEVSVVNAPAGRIYPAGIYQITDDTTISQPITLHTGASFYVAAGKTLTINGAVYAGNEYIFAGPGSVVGSFGNVALNPFWFGAVANGNIDTGAGTDDGPAFQRCINARTPSTTIAQMVQVPPGHFLINTRINIPSGISLIGSGPWSSYLVCPSAFASDVVRFNGVGGPPSRLSGFSINAQTGGAGGATGVNIATNGTFVDNVWINGFLLGLVVGEGGDNFVSAFAVEICTTGIYVTGTDCNFSNGTVYACSNGVVVGNNASAGIGQTVFDGIRATSCAQVGFYVSAGKHVQFNACSASHVNGGKFSDSGFKIDGASSDISIAGCKCILGSVSATGYGIKISGSAGNVVVSGAVCSGWVDGINIDTSGVDIIVSDVVATGNGRHGIYSIWTGPQLIIKNCICTYGGSVAAGDSGIRVDSTGAFQNMIVSGNITDQNGGGPMEYGIHISVAVASSKGVCQGNTCANAATANILIDGASAANVIVTGANA